MPRRLGTSGWLLQSAQTNHVWLTAVTSQVENKFSEIKSKQSLEIISTKNTVYPLPWFYLLSPFHLTCFICDHTRIYPWTIWAAFSRILCYWGWNQMLANTLETWIQPFTIYFSSPVSRFTFKQLCAAWTIVKACPRTDHWNQMAEERLSLEREHFSYISSSHSCYTISSNRTSATVLSKHQNSSASLPSLTSPQHQEVVGTAEALKVSISFGGWSKERSYQGSLWNHFQNLLTKQN